MLLWYKSFLKKSIGANNHVTWLTQVNRTFLPNIWLFLRRSNPKNLNYILWEALMTRCIHSKRLGFKVYNNNRKIIIVWQSYWINVRCDLKLSKQKLSQRRRKKSRFNFSDVKNILLKISITYLNMRKSFFYTVNVVSLTYLYYGVNVFFFFLNSQSTNNNFHVDYLRVWRLSLTETEETCSLNLREQY